EAIGIWIRQRLKDDAIEDAEDRGRGADAERQREHRREREAGRAAQLTHPEAQILKQCVHETPRLEGLDEERCRAVDRSYSSGCCVIMASPTTRPAIKCSRMIR